jgi:ABC-type glycerol-3-phosphate transport system substrate-binding protein
VVAINASSKVKDAAFELLKYLASTEVQKKRYQELRTPPSRPDAGDDSEFFQVMSESITGGYVYGSFPQAQEAWNVIHSYFDRVVLANRPASEVFTSRVISQINKALSR